MQTLLEKIVSLMKFLPGLVNLSHLKLQASCPAVMGGEIALETSLARILLDNESVFLTRLIERPIGLLQLPGLLLPN